jgi:hypothetical protein
MAWSAMSPTLEGVRWHDPRMTPTVAAACCAAVLGTAAWAAGRSTGWRRRLQVPPARTGSLLVIGAVSVLQLTLCPGPLDGLRRNRPALGDGGCGGW